MRSDLRKEKLLLKFISYEAVCHMRNTFVGLKLLLYLDYPCQSHLLMAYIHFFVICFYGTWCCIIFFSTFHSSRTKI